MNTADMKNILVIDDDPLCMFSMLKILCDEGYHVVAVNSPETVISSINAGDFEVIITDFNMEPVNGIELVRTLRGRGFSGKAILVSGIYHPDGKEMAEAGIGAFFEKPFEIEGICKKIREYMGEKSRFDGHTGGIRF